MYPNMHPYYTMQQELLQMRATYSITVNVSVRKLTLYKDGQVYKTYPVGVGKPATPTPKGNFTIINRAVNPGGPFGVRWLGLNKPGYGIHGTNAPWSIGKAFDIIGC